MSNCHLLQRLDEKIQSLIELARQAGIDARKISGWRSIPDQWSKFQEGRVQVNGVWTPIDPIHHEGIVTWATPDKAPHCTHVDNDGSRGSAACDVGVFKNGKYVGNSKQQGYQLYWTLGDLGESLDLAWGGRWGKIADMDHFELADWRSLAFDKDWNPT